MPTLNFFPWTTIAQRLRVGAYQLIPCGEAIASGNIPPDLRDAVAAVLASYGKTRVVDRSSVPLLQYDAAGVVDELSDEQVEGHFEFRYRLAFSTLAERRFFGHRYSNSDNVRLVVQRFTPEHAGGAVITSRRRDGAVNNIIPKGSLRIGRPEHVSGWCSIPQDLDVSLLEALERAAEKQGPGWPRLADAIRLFVGANTDSPDVSVHSELVDLVSAFSRLADAWNEDATVGTFLKFMPPPLPLDVIANDSDPVPAPGFGPKLTDARMTKAFGKGRVIREIWLRDAYVLRSQLGHGHIATSPYPSLWSVHEHLLLGGLMLPLFVKRLLASERLYEWSAEDQVRDEVFDALATIEPFASNEEGDGGGVDEDDEEPRTHPWREVFNRANIRRLARLLYADAERITEAQDLLPSSSESGGTTSSSDGIDAPAVRTAPVDHEENRR